MRYWLDTFNEETWAEFEAAGSSISGFPARRAQTVNLLQEGDILLMLYNWKESLQCCIESRRQTEK